MTYGDGFRPVKVCFKGVWVWSKTEGRWLFVIDRLATGWTYEPEKYVFKDGLRYGADVYVPDWRAHIEIKPFHESEARIGWENLKRLATETKRLGILIAGNPGWAGDYRAFAFTPQDQRVIRGRFLKCPCGYPALLSDCLTRFIPLGHAAHHVDGVEKFTEYDEVMQAARNERFSVRREGQPPVGAAS